MAIAKTLSVGDKQYHGEKLPFTRYRFSDDHSSIIFKIEKKSYNCELNLNLCAVEQQKPDYKGEVLSPDGTLAVFIREFNLWVRDTETLLETQLTIDGIKNFGYGTNNAGWTRSHTPVLLWSPDSKKVTTFQHDSRKVGDMHLVNTQVGHPVLDSWKYSLPGDEHIFCLHRVVIDITLNRVTRLKMAPDAQRSTITDHIYSRGKMLDAQWSDDGKSLAIVSVSRDHKQATLQIVNPRTGLVSTIMDEKVASFFESGKGKFNWHYLPESNEILWFSQRSDWGHLYLYNLTTAKLKQPVTNGDWNVLQLLNIDKANRTLYFTGAGREKGDPYFQYFYSVNFDGTQLKLLTPEQANHRITLNDKGGYFLDRFSTPTQPEISQIRKVNGDVAIALEKADISKLIASG